MAIIIKKERCISISQLYKKTIDSDIDKYLEKFDQESTELSWDLHELNLPRCAFGELGLKCTACLQGPCRINPFSEKEQRGVCGRTKDSMIAENFARYIISGLDDFIIDLKNVDLYEKTQKLLTWLNGGLNLPSEELLKETMELSDIVISVAAQNNFEQKIENKEITKSDDYIVLVLGKIPQDKLDLFTGKENTKVYSLLNEFPYQNVDSLVNYGNQEFIFEKGIPDLLVLGPGCCMPNILKLAKKYSIPYKYYYELTESYLSELEKTPSKEGGLSKIESLDTIFNKPNLERLKNQKIALLSGCNNIRQTHDEEIYKLVDYLLENNYFILISGCAALSVAKYFKEYQDRIFYLGSCYETVKYFELINKLDNPKEVIAVFSEVSQPRITSIALGIAQHNIPTYIVTKFLPIPSQSGIEKILAKLNNKLMINYEGNNIRSFIKL